jgi:hypothetical protein
MLDTNILIDHTINLLSMDGFFISVKDIENNFSNSSNYYAVKCFNTLKSIYEIADSNYKKNNLLFSKSLLLQLNLYTGYSGIFRKYNIDYYNSKVIPPEHKFIRDYVNFFTDYINIYKKNLDIELIFKLHVLFDALHLFEEGNGITNRILLNYLMISKGHQPIVITKDKSNRYTNFIEDCKVPLADVFRIGFDENELTKILNSMNTNKLVNLFKSKSKVSMKIN